MTGPSERTLSSSSGVGDNSLLQAPALLRAGQRESTLKRRFALMRRLKLAFLEIQRRKPPHVASLERHGDRRIQNRRRAIPIPQPAVGLGEQRQVVRPSRLRAVPVEPVEGRLDDRDAFGGSLLPARPPNEGAGPVTLW
jgi:hypothetical protein